MAVECNVMFAEWLLLGRAESLRNGRHGSLPEGRPGVVSRLSAFRQKVVETDMACRAVTTMG